MITMKEGNVLFHFADECQVIKYDEEDFYTKNLKGRDFKAVDFIATTLNQTLWIEAKDFRAEVKRNKIRFIADDKKLNKINKQHAKNMNNCCSFQDIQKYDLELKPNKEPLIDEIVKKLKDTLSGLCLLKNYFQLKDFNTSPLYKYTINLNNNVKIKIILFLIWDNNLTAEYDSFNRLAKLLEQKIKDRFGFPNLEVKVVNQDTFKKLPILTKMGISFKIT